MSYAGMVFKSAAALSLCFSMSIYAAEKTTMTSGGLRVELHCLPAEPFFTADEAASMEPSLGMLVMGGEAPVSMDSGARPNHHLVIHVYDAKSGKAITDAKVKMSFQALDAKGNPKGSDAKVPVVTMQAIGKGGESTHYGNNVTMPAGKYGVTVEVNGNKMAFRITASDARMSGKHNMHSM